MAEKQLRKIQFHGIQQQYSVQRHHAYMRKPAGIYLAIRGHYERPLSQLMFFRHAHNVPALRQPAAFAYTIATRSRS